MKSYSTPFANSGHTSRVEVAPAAWSALVEARALEAEDADDLPRFVLHDPTGTRHAIRTSSQLRVLDAIALADRDLVGIAHVLEWGAILGGNERRWDGKTFDGYDDYQERTPRFDTRITFSGVQLASRVVGGDWISVVQEHASLRARASIRVFVRAAYTWLDVVPGNGVAAIDERGGVIVVFVDGRVLLYGADGDADDEEGQPRVTAQLDEGATYVSAIGQGAALLTVRSNETRARWVDATGSVVWDVRVPFEATQPAIDGGDGRVYIAGSGLASIERGRVAWSTPSPTRLRATAYGDGSLAVCADTQLQLVAPTGAVTRTAITPIAATLLTPPAIDPSGNVWVASSDRLWVTK